MRGLGGGGCRGNVTILNPKRNLRQTASGSLFQPSNLFFALGDLPRPAKAGHPLLGGGQAPRLGFVLILKELWLFLPLLAFKMGFYPPGYFLTDFCDLF